VLPAYLSFGAAVPDPALRPGLDVPAHIEALAGRTGSREPDLG
jgi:hypothetical protein